MKNLYFRNDPDSREAYYEMEKPNIHIDVGADLNKLQFVWDRHKSNENLVRHSFSHYLTRCIYGEDDYRVLNGQRVGREEVYIKTDEGKTGLLCAFYLDIFQKVEEELPEKVVLIIRQDKLDNSRIRLIELFRNFSF
jgi:hypothetical protein